MTVLTNRTRITDKSTRCFFLEAHGAHQLIQIHVIISVRKKRFCKDCFIMIFLNGFYGTQPLIHSQDVNLE